MWRHGDVLVRGVEAIPSDAERVPGNVLARGEATGHAHRVTGEGSVELWRSQQRMFLRVGSASVQIVHEEHHPITLQPGTYQYWMQREYSPQEIRRVID
jgi:hypothetical protein